MKLVSARVRQFRNIIDSGRVSVQPSATGLVGKNDSGKTAFLHALYRLNPAYPEDAAFSVVRDYPRWRALQDRRSLDLGKVVPVEAEFILEPDDRRVLEEHLKVEVPPSTFLTVSRSYDGERSLTLRSDQRDLVGRAVAAAGLEGPDTEAAGANSSLDDLSAWARSTADSAGRKAATRVESLKRLRELAARFTALEGEPDPAMRDLLQQRLPKLFYFDEYSLLPGRINLDQLLQRKPEDLTRQDRTCLAFLRLGGVGRDELGSDDFEARVAGLEMAAGEISREVFTYWSQEPQLQVILVGDSQEPARTQEAAPPTPRIDIRLRDARHRMTVNLDAHSSGFRWFFSFVTAFADFVQDSAGTIVLLDEPGPNLHPRAQRDLLRFIDSRLSGENQVIYTTHSPFMVDPSNLERVRTVEDPVGTDDNVTGSIIRSAPFSSDSDTVLPLQAALAYQALHAFVDSDATTLVVPKVSDYIFLTELSRHLAQLGRHSLGDGFRVVPLGDFGKLALFTRLTSTKGTLMVLLDGHAFGEPEVYELLAEGRVSPWGIVSLTQVTGVEKSTVEDLFAAKDYLRLVSGALGRPIEPQDLAPNGRILEWLEQHQQGSLDRELPANHLLRTRPAFLESLDEETVEQFDQLFEMLQGAR